MHFVDHYRQCVQISYKALLANKGRSFLTMLGIIIGVSAVIIIMSVGAGAQSLILAQVKALGTNLVGVLPGASEEGGPPASAMGIAITTFTYEDLKALMDKRNVPNVVDGAGYYNISASVSWGSSNYDTSVSGTTVGYLFVEDSEVAEGRFFTKDEETNLAKVAVLGSTVKKELFGDSDPIGKKIKIKKHTFDVIGVMKDKGTVAMQNYDDKILVPLKTIQKLVAGVNHLGFARFRIDSADNADTAIEDIKITLRERHDIKDQSGVSDDFTVRSAMQAMDMIKTVTNGLRFFLVAIAAIALVVGGVGIMNIMLVSVTERTREIGLRKAVGADNFDIMSQFLFEAVAVTLLGGIIGIITGVIVSFIIAMVAQFLNYDWDFVITIGSILLAVSVSTLIGLIFGLYPSRKASRLDPIEALRYE